MRDEITVQDLREILAECAGADETAGIAGDIIDTPFVELGYDSLALIETAARIKQRFGVAIADEEVAELETPRAMLGAVNSVLVESS